jgi:hypothetical protein
VVTITPPTGCPLKNLDKETTITPPLGTTTSSPTISENRVLESHGVAIYINSNRNDYNIQFNIEYDDGLALTGYEVYNGLRDYPAEALISNVHVFNKNITYPTIIDIYHTEYSVYQPTLDYNMLEMGLTNNNIEPINIGIDSNSKNVISQTYNDRYIVLGLNTIDTNTIETKYKSYDTKTKQLVDLNTTDDSFIATNTVATEHGVIMGGFQDEKYKLSFISMADTKDIDNLVSCIPGEKLVDNNECQKCPVDTYSNAINSRTCRDCPYDTGTHSKTGQSKCTSTPDFINKTIYYPLEEHTKALVKNNENKYDQMVKIQEQDSENIAAYKNNLNLMIKTI